MPPFKCACSDNEIFVIELERRRVTLESSSFGGSDNRANTFKRAAQSICTYPLPICSGREAQSLKGIGQHIGKLIDQIILKKSKGTGSQLKDAGNQAENDAKPNHSPQSLATPSRKGSGEKRCAPIHHSSSSDLPTAVKKQRTHHVISLGDLMRANLLTVGQIVTYRRFDRSIQKEITADGTITVEGAISLSGRNHSTLVAFARAIHDQAGLEYKSSDTWSTVRAGSSTLAELRSKLELSLGPKESETITSDNREGHLGKTSSGEQSLQCGQAEKASKLKEYSPKEGSAPYALLIALWRILDEEALGFKSERALSDIVKKRCSLPKMYSRCALTYHRKHSVGKQELADFAQRWANEAILESDIPRGQVHTAIKTMPADSMMQDVRLFEIQCRRAAAVPISFGGGIHYCGWSSMNKTLVAKGLVEAFSNPRRFRLTPAGEDIARRLSDAQRLRDVSAADGAIPGAAAGSKNGSISYGSGGGSGGGGGGGGRALSAQSQAVAAAGIGTSCDGGGGISSATLVLTSAAASAAPPPAPRAVPRSNTCSSSVRTISGGVPKQCSGCSAGPIRAMEGQSRANMDAEEGLVPDGPEPFLQAIGHSPRETAAAAAERRAAVAATAAAGNAKQGMQAAAADGRLDSPSPPPQQLSQMYRFHAAAAGPGNTVTTPMVIDLSTPPSTPSRPVAVLGRPTAASLRLPQAPPANIDASTAADRALLSGRVTDLFPAKDRGNVRDSREPKKRLATASGMIGAAGGDDAAAVRRLEGQGRAAAGVGVGAAGLMREKEVATEAVSALAAVNRAQRVEEGEWEVALLVDTAEPEALLRLLLREGVPFRRKRLCIGDFLWVALPRRRTVVGSSAMEDEDVVGCGAVVLDMIVERKRADDLIGSIVGKRYSSQKHRIRETGVSRKVYLVEGSLAIHGKSTPYSKCTTSTDWEVRLRSATVETEAHDGFMVFRTHDLAGTATCLRRLTFQMTKLVEQFGVCQSSAVWAGDGPERLDIFEQRAQDFQTRLTANDLLQLQLHAGVRGLGPAAAAALGKAWGTLAGALDAVEGCRDAAALESVVAAACKAHGTKTLSRSAVARLFDLLRSTAY